MNEFEIVDAAFLVIKKIAQKYRIEPLSSEESNDIKTAIRAAMIQARLELRRGN